MRFAAGLIGLLAVLGAVSLAGAQPSPAVEIRNFEFAPAQIRVDPGTTVSWKNAGPAVHTVTADGGAFDSGALAKDATFSFRFAGEGVFAYHCSIHSSMHGQIVVGTAAAPEKPENPGGY